MESHPLPSSTVGVIGNHDFESGRVSEVHSILKETGLSLLHGESAFAVRESRIVTS
jgi:hypothetical protein